MTTPEDYDFFKEKEAIAKERARKAVEQETVRMAVYAFTAIVVLFAIGFVLYFKLQFAEYVDDQYKFTIKYPKTWKVVPHPSPNVAVVFMRPKDTVMDQIQENFNVTVQPVAVGDTTLAAFSAKVKMQMSAVFGRSIKFVEDKPMRWGWRQGRMLAIEAPYPDHLKMVNAWVLQGTQVYILTFLGDMNKYQEDGFYVDEMIGSLRLHQRD